MDDIAPESIARRSSVDACCYEALETSETSSCHPVAVAKQLHVHSSTFRASTLLLPAILLPAPLLPGASYKTTAETARIDFWTI